MAFKAGDLVRLKSSAVPAMTVGSVEGDDVRCFWMQTSGGRHEKREETFPATVLVPYTPPAPAAGRVRRSAISPRF